MLEHARLRLAEDAVARERAQQPVQRVRVAAELRHRPRAVRQRLRHARVDDGRERFRHQRAAQKVPEDGLGRALAHVAGASDRGGGRLGLLVGQRQAVEQEAAVADDPDDGRLAGAERAGERLLERAREARQLGERQRAAADAADRLLDLAAGRGGKPFRALAHGRAVCCASVRRTGIRSGASSWSRSVPSSAASESLSIRSARWSGCRRSRSTSVGAAQHDPGLRPAEQLVAGEADEVGAGLERLARRRLLLT